MEEDRCIKCKFAENCIYAYHYNFCEDCKDYCKCGVGGEYCKAGFEIECNNGFELKNIFNKDGE